MRRLLTMLMLVATCGSLVLIVAQTVIGSSAGVALTGTRAVAAREAGAPSATRSWPLTMSPGPGELALAELSFGRSHRERISPGSLRVGVSGPFGDDYLAAAAPQFGTPGGPRALVLIVNRPSPLLDPVSVHIRVTALRALGAPTVRRLADPFARPAAGSAPALCELRGHGDALSGSELIALGSRGAPLVGFDTASAVAQAYDAVCGLPYASSFRQAVEQTSPAPPESPSPAPPVGKLPGEGCRPTPGYACPLAAAGASGVAAEDVRRRAAAGAH